jgi:hypothetical protein
MYDRPHYLFSIGGTAVSALEEWQTGLRFAPNAGQTEAALLDALDQISVEDMFNDFAPIIANTDSLMSYPKTLVLTFAKLAVIKPDGHYAGSPKLFEGNVPGANPVNSTAVPQVAWVATLGTGHQFGMAQRGRMYWPVPISIPSTLDGATGQVPQAHCDGFRDAVAAAITQSEGEVSTTLVPAFAAVMSKSGGVAAPQAPGTTNPITEVSVGRVLDTQRRRRGELTELYNPAPAARGTRPGLFAVPARSEAS